MREGENRERGLLSFDDVKEGVTPDAEALKRCQLREAEDDAYGGVRRAWRVW